MLQQIIKTDHVVLYPYELGHIQNALMTRLNEKCSSCSKSDGYIVRIVDVLDTSKNIISRTTGNVIFKVQYRIETFKPVLQETCKVMINIIFREGIFAEYYLSNILIPTTTLDTEWVFANDTLTHQISGRVLQPGSWITVVITTIRYEKNKYQCLARMIE